MQFSFFKKKTLPKNALCILDIETTGFVPGEAEIVELFILKVIDEKIVDEFYSLFKPENKIPNADIHGITDTKVMNSPRFKEKNNEIFEFIQGSILVGHNINNFDLEFLNHFLDKNIENETIDTLDLSRSVLKDKLPNHKLNTLAEYFDINPPTHSARDDVMTTYEVYKKLISIKYKRVNDTRIKLSNLTLSYGKEAFIKDFSLEINEPSIIKLCGPNGSGKTSLLRYISGIFEGSEKGESFEVVAPQGIKLLDSSPSLIEDLSVEENIQFLTGGRVSDKKSLHNLLLRVGMAEFGEELVSNLSSGMKRKVEIATLMEDASILCLDEPQNFMDEDGIRIINFMNEMCLSRKGIVIYSSLNDNDDKIIYDLKVDLN